MGLIEKPDIVLAEKIHELDGGYPTEAELVQLVMLGSAVRLHPGYYEPGYIDSKTRFFQLDSNNLKRFARLRHAYETSMPLDVKFQILIHPDPDNHTFNTVGNTVHQSGIIEIWTVQELISTLADMPDCDDCERIDPDDPPIRHNEGYD